MHTNLKQLQQYKGSKKEFAFLKPVTEYIAEHYGEIQDDLSTANVSEIFEEIQQINTNYNKVFVYYDTPETIIFNNRYSMYITEDTKKEGLGRIGYSNSWSRNNNAPLSELYYIADFNLYEEYLEQQRQEKVKELIQHHLNVAKRQQEEEEKYLLKLAEDKRLRAKYDLKLNENTDKAKALETILESTDKAAQYEAFNKLQDNQIDEDYIREIANNEACEVYNDREDW